MTQLVQEPNRGGQSFPQQREALSEPLLPVPEDFDETDVPDCLHRGRLMVFIDGANLFYAASQMAVEIDYAKLLRYFQHQSTLVYAFFYTGVDPNNMRQRAFLTWMQRNGYRVVTKEVVLNAAGAKRASNMNVEISVDMMRFCTRLRYRDFDQRRWRFGVCGDCRFVSGGKSGSVRVAIDRTRCLNQGSGEFHRFAQHSRRDPKIAPAVLISFFGETLVCSGHSSIVKFEP